MKRKGMRGKRKIKKKIGGGGVWERNYRSWESLKILYVHMLRHQAEKLMTSP